MKLNFKKLDRLKRYRIDSISFKFDPKEVSLSKNTINGIRFLFLILTFSVSLPLIAQNNTISALEIDTTTKGFLPLECPLSNRCFKQSSHRPHYYNIDTFTLNVYSGASWVQVGVQLMGPTQSLLPPGKWMDRNLVLAESPPLLPIVMPMEIFINGVKLRRTPA